MVKPPYFGSAYYPEDWPAEQMDEDIAMMKTTGMNVVRMAEFAWCCMEPAEGCYDFAWLHRAVDRLGAAGIVSVLGTPTCTPPAWLSEKYPEILCVGDLGAKAHHGSRRHACPNSPVYREFSARMVTRMAEEFGNDANVIAWQIDNELYPYSSRGCACDVCQKRFRERLREKFGDIATLNSRWDLNLWSQAYQSFEQVPVPHSDTWHHPSLTTEWMVFQSDSYCEFAAAQSDILHRLARQPVGTDMMPFCGVDYYRMHRTLDLVQFNHYNDTSNLWQAAYWMDWCRPIKDRPFWVTETSTCWGGGTVPGGYNERGFCTANSWLPLALGGEANMYWLWRTHWAGHELMHGSVLQACGRPMHTFDEVREVSRGFAVAADLLNSTRPVQARIAMHMSTFAWWFFQAQPLVHGFAYAEWLAGEIYRPLQRAHMRLDVVDPCATLDPYQVVISAFLPALDDGGLRERLHRWIEEGGIWIAAPFTDIRTLDATRFRHAPFGSLEEWGGVHCKYEVPASREFRMRWQDGRETLGALWYSGFEPRGAQALACYTEYPFEGLAAVTRHRLGKGQVVVLGTMPGAVEWRNLIVSLASEQGVLPVARASGNLMVVPRQGDGGSGVVVVELDNEPATLTLPRAATDLLSGETLCGDIPVDRHGVRVLRY